MDRLIYTALNALNVNRDTQVTQAQNLANQSVPGFRRDMSNNGDTKFLQALDGVGARAFQLETDMSRFSSQNGDLNRTDAELDVAIADRGYFFVQPQEGDPALSRRGDLRRDGDGVLKNGAGEAMLDPTLAPIVLPPYRTIRITDIGEIFIQPADQPAGEAVLAGVLATAIPGADAILTKGPDGQIRQQDGTVPAPDQRAQLLQGVLEGSNVNPVEEMLSSMQVQREFEMGMRMILAARDLDESGARVMQAPEG